MSPKNKIVRYGNLIKRFSNWPAYLSFKMRSRHDTFTFQLRNAFPIEVHRSMIPAFKESFFDDVYFRQLPPFAAQRADPVVLDVGANVGYFSLASFAKFPQAQVYAFEPMPFNYQQLQRYHAFYPQFAWHIINEAVSDTSEPLVLHTTKTDGYTTMASVFNGPRNKESVSVNSTTLNNVMNDYQLSRVDFLKLDCEGSEYAILYSLPVDQLNKIRAMCVETHRGNRPDQTNQALRNYLTDQQFTLTYLDQGKSGYIWAWRA